VQDLGNYSATTSRQLKRKRAGLSVTLLLQMVVRVSERYTQLHIANTCFLADHPEAAVVRVAHHLYQSGTSLHMLGIQVVQIGADIRATAALRSLEHDVQRRGFYVSTSTMFHLLLITYFTGHIASHPTRSVVPASRRQISY
jgi:hypothetical protein